MKSKIGMIIVCVLSVALIVFSIYMDIIRDKKRQRPVSEFDNIDYSDGYDDGYDEGYNDAENHYSDEIDFYNALHSNLISRVMLDAPTVKFGDWFEVGGYTMNIIVFKKTVNNEEKTCLRLTVKMKNGKSSFTESDMGDKKLNIQTAYDRIFCYDEKNNNYYSFLNLTSYFFPSWTDDVFVQKDDVEYAKKILDMPLPNTLYILAMSDNGQLVALILKNS